MLKGYEFNREYRVLRGGMYAQEVNLLHEFCASKHENIRFEYSTKHEAKNAAQGIRRHIGLNRMPLEAKQRGVYVFVVKGN